VALLAAGATSASRRGARPVGAALGENARLLAAAAAGRRGRRGAVPALLLRQAQVSLLNTFAALVLPTMANGYSIFLLKGFFAACPELYEAADLDGAGEWTKFWALTMNLSSPSSP